MLMMPWPCCRIAWRLLWRVCWSAWQARWDSQSLGISWLLVLRCNGLAGSCVWTLARAQCYLRRKGRSSLQRWMRSAIKCKSLPEKAADIGWAPIVWYCVAAAWLRPWLQNLVSCFEQTASPFSQLRHIFYSWKESAKRSVRVVKLVEFASTVMCRQDGECSK